MIDPKQRLNTQHSQQTDIHAPGRIRTHSLSRSAAADLHLTLRGNWDRLSNYRYCSEIRTAYRIRSGLYTRRRYELLHRICIFMYHTKHLKLPGNYYYVMHIFHIRFYFPGSFPCFSFTVFLGNRVQSFIERRAIYAHHFTNNDFSVQPQVTERVSRNSLSFL